MVKSLKTYTLIIQSVLTQVSNSFEDTQTGCLGIWETLIKMVLLLLLIELFGKPARTGTRTETWGPMNVEKGTSTKIWFSSIQWTKQHSSNNLYLSNNLCSHITQTLKPPTHSLPNEGMDGMPWPLRWLFHPFLFWKSSFSFGYHISLFYPRKMRDTKTINLYIYEYFFLHNEEVLWDHNWTPFLNSQGVPIKFSMCSSRCSQLEHILSHMFCLKLTF